MLDLNIPLNREIVSLIDMGWSNSEISNELELAESEVEAVVAEYFNDIHEEYLGSLEEEVEYEDPFLQLDPWQY